MKNFFATTNHPAKLATAKLATAKLAIAHLPAIPAIRAAWLALLIAAALFAGCASKAQSPAQQRAAKHYQHASRLAAAQEKAAKSRAAAAAQKARSEEWSRTQFHPGVVSRIEKASKLFAHTPYRLGGESPRNGADCSAFTQSVFLRAFGIHLPRTTPAQEASGVRIGSKPPRRSDLRQLASGDLLFFRGRGPHATHVGIYLSRGRFVHLSSRGGARIGKLGSPYWRERLREIRRVLR